MYATISYLFDTLYDVQVFKVFGDDWTLHRLRTGIYSCFTAESGTHFIGLFTAAPLLLLCSRTSTGGGGGGGCV